MNKKLGFIFGFIGPLIIVKFWLGIYSHDEFGGKHIFIKHRPIWKTFFYSPQGMSDLKLSEMDVEKKSEQILFEEFISNQGLSK